METETSIASMTGAELVQYLNVLSAKQAEFSKLKIQLTEELTPIQKDMAEKKAQIQMIVEKQRQVRIEIAACKYGIRAEQQ